MRKHRKIPAMILAVWLLLTTVPFGSFVFAQENGTPAVTTDEAEELRLGHEDVSGGDSAASDGLTEDETGNTPEDAADEAARGGLPSFDLDMGEVAYKDHAIPVTVMLNRDHVRMPKLTVTDELSKHGLVLKEEDGVRVNGALLPESGGQEAARQGAAGQETTGQGTDGRPSYRYDGDTLYVYPQELAEEERITFTVQPTDEYLYEHRSEAMIGFENEATLTSEESGEMASAADISFLQNCPLVKTGSVDLKRCVISYAVEFNRTLTELPEGLTLADTLPEGLLFCPQSVRLWIAEVDDFNGHMTKTDREAEGYAVSFGVSGANAVMLVSLPPGKQAYILEYDTQIAKADRAPFINRAEVTGYTENGAIAGELSISREKVAGAAVGSLYYAQVNKTDPEGNPLSGALFAMEKDGETLLLGATGEDGQLVFAGMEPGAEYTVSELQAPEGYAAADAAWTFLVDWENGMENAAQKSFVNYRIEKKDDSGNPAGGGEPKENAAGSGGTDSSAPSGEISRTDGAADAAKSAAAGTDALPERLPKTGGFWGSGLMYMIGIALGLAGAMCVLHFTKEAGKGNGKDAEGRREVR